MNDQKRFLTEIFRVEVSSCTFWCTLCVSLFTKIFNLFILLSFSENHFMKTAAQIWYLNYPNLLRSSLQLTVTYKIMSWEGNDIGPDEDRPGHASAPEETVNSTMESLSLSNFNDLEEDCFPATMISNTPVLAEPLDMSSYPTPRDLLRFASQQRRPPPNYYYLSEANRLESFRDWPERAHVCKEDLARNGFIFTGTSDKVQMITLIEGCRFWTEFIWYVKWPTFLTPVGNYYLGSVISYKNQEKNETSASYTTRRVVHHSKTQKHLIWHLKTISKAHLNIIPPCTHIINN